MTESNRNGSSRRHLDRWLKLVSTDRLPAYVDVDARDSDRYAVYVTQSGLTLPDRDYYLEDEPRYVKLRDQVKIYIADMLTFLSVPDAASAADAIFRNRNQDCPTPLDQDRESRPRQDLQQEVDGRDECTARRVVPVAAFSPTTVGSVVRRDFVVRQPSYLEAFGDLFTETDLEDWKNYLRLRVIDSYASSLSEAIERRHFDFHGTAISGSHRTGAAVETRRQRDRQRAGRTGWPVVRGEVFHAGSEAADERVGRESEASVRAADRNSRLDG